MSDDLTARWPLASLTDESRTALLGSLREDAAPFLAEVAEGCSHADHEPRECILSMLERLVLCAADTIGALAAVAPSTDPAPEGETT